MANPQVPPMVNSFFESYRSAFERLDAEGIADHFIYPCLVTGDSPKVIPQSIASIDEWIPQVRQLVVGYRTIGFSSARILDLSVIELSPRLMHAAVSWELLSASKEALYDFRVLYTLAEKDGRLKIAAIAHNETPKFLEALKKAKPAKPSAAGAATPSA